jgi:signal transduction protein with GAF and PtsI domain
MTRRDLLHQLAEASIDLQAVLVSSSISDQLDAVCSTARVVFGAQAVSIAIVRDDALHYVAASGVGSTEIVGTVMPLQRGLGGYVALTGEAIAVDRPSDDPRFARDVAERTGFIPSSLLIVPVSGPRGESIGVLTVLDRTVGTTDALGIASAFAEQLGTVLPTVDDTARGARILLDAVIDAVRSGDAHLADALGRALIRLPAEDAGVAATAVVLERLRRSDDATRERTSALIVDLVELATAKRRR